MKFKKYLPSLLLIKTFFTLLLVGIVFGAIVAFLSGLFIGGEKAILEYIRFVVNLPIFVAIYLIGKHDGKNEK